MQSTENPLISAYGATLIDDADAATARSTLGLGTMATATEANYPLLTGARAMATSQAQVFTNGVVTGIVRPASDSTTAVRLQNAAGASNIFTVNSVDEQVYVGNPTVQDVYDRLYVAGGNPGIRMEVQRAWGGAVFDLFNLYAKKTSASGVANIAKIGILCELGADSVASTPFSYYLYFGCNAGVSYLDNTLRLYPDKTVYFDGNVGIGIATPGNKLDVLGTIQADGLRLDVTPTAETPTATHTITISANGTNYKLLCVAA